MKIAVLDFNCSSVDIISVDESFIDEKYNGEVEDFLVEHCQYNPDMIQWMAPVQELNLDMTKDSFEADEFIWKPDKSHFKRFQSRFDNDRYTVDEIIISDSRILNTGDEVNLTMRFYDGYAIEEQNNNSPLVLLYPTINEVRHWACLLDGVLEYVQGASKNDLTPHDIALKWGVLFRFEEVEYKNFEV